LNIFKDDSKGERWKIFPKKLKNFHFHEKHFERMRKKISLSGHSRSKVGSIEHDEIL
jgi:hypothetical protein